MKVAKKIYLLLTIVQRKKVLIIGIMILFAMGFEFLSLGALIPILGILMSKNIKIDYPILAPIIYFIGNPNREKLIYISLSLLVTLYIIKAFFLLILAWQQAKLSANITSNLSKKLFQGYLSLPYAFHLNRNSAELFQYIQNQVSVFNSILQSIIVISTEISIVVCIMVFLFLVEPLGTSTLAFFFIISSYLFYTISKKKLFQWGNNRQQHLTKITQHILQALGGIREVLIMGKEDFFIKKFDSHNVSQAAIAQKMDTVGVLPRIYLETLTILGITGLIFFMTIQNKPTETFLPVLGIFMAGVFRIMPSINKILSSVQIIKYSESIIENVNKELNLIKSGSKKISNINTNCNFTNKISIENLTFKYVGTEKNAIDDINIEIFKGKSIGIIGLSGSGKSTFLDLLLGLHSPSSGKILIDGQNMEDCMKSWQNQIGYVPQNIYLTDDSFKNNIAFGINEDEINFIDLNNSIKAARVDSFIDSQVDGIETLVGERGVRISGGQKQRIGIARALYKNPNILILDEATSALDTKTENEVMEAVNSLHGIKTIIIVAHRLSTVEKCDIIYKLQGGKIIEIIKRT
jgi:ABC-type bacteriocin/lantibiotic exporter with double-glycine peptidase domain